MTTNEQAQQTPNGQTRAPSATSTEWIALALCGIEDDPDQFFPDNGARTDLHSPAKRICSSCRVQDECLEWALATRQKFGIWGGKTRHERRRIAADRIRAANGETLSPQEAQDWLRTADAFAVDQLAKVLEHAAEGTLMPDFRQLAQIAFAAAAELLDEADSI